MEGGEFEGEFGALCTREKIKQELTTADTFWITHVAHALHANSGCGKREAHIHW